MVEHCSVAAVTRVRFPLVTPTGIELETARFLFWLRDDRRFQRNDVFYTHLNES